MRREVRNILVLLAIPCVIWCLVSLYYVIRSYTNLGFQIKNKPALQVSTHLVGTRFVNAFPDDMVSSIDTLKWSSPAYTVQIDPNKKTMTVHSPRFVRDAQLTYDGWRWGGFANIPNRKSPIKVDVW